MPNVVNQIVIAVLVAILMAIIKPFLGFITNKLGDGAPGFLVSMQKALTPSPLSPQMLQRRLQIFHVFQFLAIFGSLGIVLLLYFQGEGVVTYESLFRILAYAGTAFLLWVPIGFLTFNIFLDKTPIVSVPGTMTFLIYTDLILLFFLVQETGGPLNSVFVPFYPAFPILAIQFVSFGPLHVLLLPLLTLAAFLVAVLQETLTAGLVIGRTVVMAIPIIFGAYIGFYSQ